MVIPIMMHVLIVVIKVIIIIIIIIIIIVIIIIKRLFHMTVCSFILIYCYPSLY